MNTYMNKVALITFSYFDTGKNPARSEPESGFGRYDVVLEPCSNSGDAIILEFKVHDPEDEKTLNETVKVALEQIEDKKYAQVLEMKEISPDRIRRYRFAYMELQFGRNTLSSILIFFCICPIYTL